MTKRTEYSNTPSITSVPTKWNDKKLSKATEYVLDRFIYLYTLKQHRLMNYWKYRSEYSQLNQVDSTNDGFTRYHMNTWFAIVNAKVAEIFASTPKYDFVGLDDEGRKYKKMVEKLWDWVWMKSWTNGALMQIVRDACKYGTWFWKEVWERTKRTVKLPQIDDETGEVTFIEEERIEYEGCKLVPLDWSNVYVNGVDINNCTEAIVISHWDKAEFFSTFKNNWFWKYDKEDIHPWKNYYVPSNTNELVIQYTTWRDWSSIDDENTISVVEYWNKYKDEYIVIAWDCHINPYKEEYMPIPSPHKEINLVCYTDHQVDGDIYGRGEFDITDSSRRLKDESRSLMIESVKMQGWIITIDPSSDFDETVERIWLKQFARVEKDDFWFFSPNINISPLELLEKKIDEDIIIETWVDFRGQLFGPNETAERSKWRVESARKRINSNIKENAYTFYARLAALRIENIQTYYKWKNDLIPVKWFSITNTWVQDSLSWDYGVMEITKDMLSGKILLLPIVDSLTWNTTKELRQKWMEFFQIAINLKKSDGTPVFDTATLIESWRGYIDDAVDLDKLLWGNASVDAEVSKLLKERWLPNPNDINSAMQENGWIPPAQQSGRPILLPSTASDNSQE